MLNRRVVRNVWLVVLVAAAPRLQGQDAAAHLADRIDSLSLRAHLRFLSSDALEGRASGTRGAQVAALYIATVFRRLGLAPAGDSGGYEQEFVYYLDAGNEAFDSAGPGRRRIEGRNVVARLPGAPGEECVVLSAHYDHLGIGPAVLGDSIYNGALDNASGVAGLLTIAEAVASGNVQPRRCILFAAFDGEETGFRGSVRFLQQAMRAGPALAGVLNFDGLNLFAPTTDTWAIGLRYSDLGDRFRAAAAAEGLAVRIPPVAARFLASQEFFTRSDQYPFARAGIPGLFLWSGYGVVGQPPDWMQRQLQQYLLHQYHRPGDEFRESYRYAGAVQQLRVALRTLLAAASDPRRPQWRPDSPYQRSASMPSER